MPDAPEGAKCPICGRSVVPRHHPFCSRRCADVDLARWLTGSYVVPGTPPEEEEDEQRENPPESDD